MPQRTRAEELTPSGTSLSLARSFFCNHPNESGSYPTVTHTSFYQSSLTTVLYISFITSTSVFQLKMKELACFYFSKRYQPTNGWNSFLGFWLMNNCQEFFKLQISREMLKGMWQFFAITKSKRLFKGNCFVDFTLPFTLFWDPGKDINCVVLWYRERRQETEKNYPLYFILYALWVAVRQIFYYNSKNTQQLGRL